MRKKYFIFFTSLILLLSACSSVKISTVKNEDKKISDINGYLIYVDIADMELRKSLETALVDKLTKKGKIAKESIVLFPPIKEYSSHDIKEISINSKLNAKLTITPLNSSKETGYMYMNGILVPVTSTNSSFDLTLNDFMDDVIILHSTVNTEGDSVKYITSTIAQKIVTELLIEECKEFISIMQNLANSELQILPVADTKYSIKGYSKIGEISISNGVFEIKLPTSFKSISDDKGLIELINSDGTEYCRIIIKNSNDLPYVVELLKEFNVIKNKSHNIGSQPTAGQTRCSTTSCYVDARTGALLSLKKELGLINLMVCK